MSNPHIPNPQPNRFGGTSGAVHAPGQFSVPVPGIPNQGGGQPVPAPQAWGQPGPYPMARPARPQLSTRVRLCLRLELVLSVIALVNKFIPYLFDDLSIYFERFTDIWFYESVITYIVVIVLSAVALRGRSKAVRYALVGVVLVSFLLLDPVLAVLEGGTWYWLFLPPTLDPSVFGDHWYASLLVVRGVLIWLIVRSILIIAIVLAVPDRRPSAPAPVGGPFVAAPMQGGHPAPGGAVPPHGVNPVAPQGMWPAAAQGAVSAPAAAPAPAPGIPQPGAGAGSPDQ
ncbi:hypothetical protein [Actinomyces sp. ICM58]|uniref:hypothetical protein n=1 Tax=Actinomyces sp. ICM58 TaxID=1105030 RepID=UPI0009DA600B|nr:hypothetical protein [Actinomyces sp. ICM58]